MPNLEEAKEGDTVFISRKMEPVELGIVEKITDKNLVKVGTQHFFRNGNLRGSGPAVHTRAWLPTKEQVREHKHRTRINFIRHYIKWDLVPEEVVIDIYGKLKNLEGRVK
jgi:hypothetical protein